MKKECKEECKEGVSSEEIAEFVKILNGEEHLNELRTNLRGVAESRGLAGASLALHFRPDLDDVGYYNVYKYAFFGMVPENELYVNPRAIDAPSIERYEILTKQEK